MGIKEQIDMRKVIAVLVIVLLSCSSKPQSIEKVEYKWGDDSLLHKIVSYNDTLQSEVGYRKDSITKEGVAKYYNEGKLFKLMYYKRGNLVGSYTEYYRNGRPSLFICHDSYGDTIFLRTYDSTGTILYEEGEMSAHGFVDDSIGNGQTIKQYSFIVNAPYTSVSIDNYLLYNDFKDTLRPISERVAYDWIHTYTFELPKQGMYKHKQVTIIMDSLKKKGYRTIDSVIRNVSW